MPRVTKETVKSLSAKYPDFEIIKPDMMVASKARTYVIRHKPTGQRTACVGIRNLADVESMILRYEQDHIYPGFWHPLNS